ncbi:MAG: hypothetical protein ACMG6S_04345 [Byssovorax sp.]
MTSPAEGDEIPSQGPPAPPPRSTRRARILGGAAAALALAGVVGRRRLTRFPPDTTPEGCYLRIVVAIIEGRARDAFPYLDEPARHAAYSIRDYRKRASGLVAAQYPEPERTRLIDAYRVFAEAPDGADVWNEMAHERGWITRLRRDLSGIARIETSGGNAPTSKNAMPRGSASGEALAVRGMGGPDELRSAGGEGASPLPGPTRVTIETARGTRYSFRRRDNGIWGLSLFTADLVAESERAARDAEVVEQAAADYARSR